MHHGIALVPSACGLLANEWERGGAFGPLEAVRGRVGMTFVPEGRKLQSARCESYIEPQHQLSFPNRSFSSFNGRAVSPRVSPSFAPFILTGELTPPSRYRDSH
jgi:hypothetical protein